jgi:hypothetical protein
MTSFVKQGRFLMPAKEICSSIEHSEVFGWEKPDFSILNPLGPAPIFPMEVFEVEVRGWIEMIAQKTSSPIDYVIGSLLSVVSSSIGNSRQVSAWDGWTEPAILWFALVGNPSSGKSPAMAPAVKLLDHIEVARCVDFEIEIKEYREEKRIVEIKEADWEKKIQLAINEGKDHPQRPEDTILPKKPTRVRLTVKDATTESLCNILSTNPKGVLYVRDELSGLIGNFDRYGNGKGDRAFWLEVYDGRRYVIDRVKNDSPIIIPNLSVSIVGGIQPAKLCSIFSGDDDGLHARFIYLYPEPVPPVRPDSRWVSDLMQLGVNRFYNLKGTLDKKGNAVPKTLYLTNNAMDTFHRWRGWHHQNQPEGLLAGWWGKLQGRVLRIALVLEYLNWIGQNRKEEPEQVTTDSLNRAIRLVEDYFYPMAERAYGEVGITEKEKLAKILAKWILKNQPEIINTRSISREAKIRELKKADKIRMAVEYLQSLDWLQKVQTENDSAGGRKREDYKINPNVYM